MKWKPKVEQCRLIFSDGPGRVMPEHAGKVFAVIGPFETFADKAGLRDALELVVRGWNLDETRYPLRAKQTKKQAA